MPGSRLVHAAARPELGDGRSHCAAAAIRTIDVTYAVRVRHLVARVCQQMLTRVDLMSAHRRGWPAPPLPYNADRH